MEPVSNEEGQNLSPLFSFPFSGKQPFSPRVYRIELLLIFGIGFTCGIILKTMATGSFTIGYEDYTVKNQPGSINLNQTEKETIASGKSFDVNTSHENRCSE